jgi:A/G-specific adenine glycosylase
VDATAVPDEARAAVLRWFDTRGRVFPFREVRDPYAVWVCETMAQQTQIGRAASKLAAFLDRFPSVQALAVAAPADVLRAWRGLGYNRRAIYLQRAAQVIVSEHGGTVPGDVAALERLPGVGPYTARAIAAFAFGSTVAPVDTNVRRVIRRLVGAAEPPQDRVLQALADAAAIGDRPADWTHAVMDLGATLCRPRSPRCGECPLRVWCRSAGLREPSELERTTRKHGTAPFPSTTRWLRGQLLDRLRDAPPNAWTTMHGPVGEHEEGAVRQALETMAREGLLELQLAAPLAARLPVASRQASSATSANAVVA